MSGWLLLTAYSVVMAPAFAIVAWGVARRFGRLTARHAWVGAAAVWAALVVAPVIGAAVDHARAASSCGIAEECYEHIFTVMAIPAGWVLALLGLAAMVVLGRTHSAAQ